MSGPAGGVTGAVWVAEQCGHRDLITFDMGGTSTDVALVQDLNPRIGRETKVGDLTVRASSVDVRTVGAGGGSIAHVPELTKALRVGPQSAGADPGPAAYGKGGTEPTVTDANVVLGYLPTSLAGGEITLDVDAARAAVADGRRRDGPASPRRPPRPGIVDIVNENMLGGLRLVSVQQGFDPRDFALVAFGGAGPLHANALGSADRRLAGDRAAVARACCARSATPPPACATSRPARCCAGSPTSTGGELGQILRELADEAAAAAGRAGAAARRADGRLPGRRPLPRAGLRDPDRRRRRRLTTWTARPTSARRFDAEHERLFSFLLDADHELVNARAIGHRPAAGGRADRRSRQGDGDPSARAHRRHQGLRRRRHAPTPAIYDRREAARRRRDRRSGDRHRDGLHDPRPARPRGHRARRPAAC